MENTVNDAIVQEHDIPAYTSAVPERPVIEFTAKEKKLAFVSLIAGFMMIRFIFAPIFNEIAIGLGAAVSLLCLCIYFFIFTSEGSRFSSRHILRILGAAAFSVNVMVTANFFIQFLSGVFAVLILIYDRLASTEMYKGGIRPSFLIEMLAAVFEPLFGMFNLSGAYKTEKGTGNTIKGIIVGLFIATPATIIVALLLASADERFNSIMSFLFENGLETAIIIILQIILGIPAAFYIFSAGWHSYNEKFNKHEARTIEGFLQPVIVTASIVPVCVLYTVFFFSQLSYYIAAFNNILPDGVTTYSEYARSGFFELCAVAVINLFIVISSVLAVRKKEGSLPGSVRVICVILVFFTLALIATAMRKMVLYMDVYGLTRLRVYTSWFMALLFLVFVACGIHFIKRINLARVIVCIFTILFSILAFSYSDAVIADYNISHCLSGDLKFDKSITSGLSSDCLPVIEKYRDRLGDEQAQKLIDSHNVRSDTLRTFTISSLSEQKSK